MGAARQASQVAVRDPRVLVELVGGAKQSRLVLAPALRLGALKGAVDRLPVDPPVERDADC